MSDDNDKAVKATGRMRIRVPQREDLSGEQIRLVELARSHVPRIDALSKILGDPPAEIVQLREKMISALDLMKAVDWSFDRSIPSLEFSEEEAQKLNTFAALKESDRSVVFRNLVDSRSISGAISALFDEYFEVCDNGDVKSKKPWISFQSELGPEFRGNANKPRWAEENRTGVRFPMRLSESLISDIDASAQSLGITRTEWFVQVIEKALSSKKYTIPPDSPEFKTTRPISIRISESLNDQISDAASRSGLSKTEWVRRVARLALTMAPSVVPDPTPR